MKIRIYQKNTKLDINTIISMWSKEADDDEDSSISIVYNPKCPIVKKKEKACKVWNKVWNAPKSEKKEQARKAFLESPNGEVLHVTCGFPKKDFNKVSNWFVQFEIPFEILNYEKSELEHMQDEIDAYEDDTYRKIHDKYEKLFCN